MSGSLKGLGAITLFVEDLAAATAFYTDVLGLTQVFGDADSAAFDFGNTLVNLLRAEAAPELVEPAAVGGPGGGARCLLTIWVDDADAACARLAGHGVTLLNGPVDRPWGQRTAAFADPAGNVWEVAQHLTPPEG